MMTRQNKGQAHPDHHFWILAGNKIVNRANHNYVCDIAAANKDDGAKVIAFPYKGSPNQHWKLKPVK